MTNSSSHIRLAVALDGAGWHPAAWREADARPDELFDAGYWADLVAEAEFRFNLVQSQIIENPFGYDMLLVSALFPAEYAQLWTGHGRIVRRAKWRVKMVMK